MNVQYKKGVIELCVLALLNKRDMYGYEISELISKMIDISDGTIYPILRKLNSDRFLTTYLSEESGGPPRKYYSLTKEGKRELDSQRKDWMEFTLMVDKILKGDYDD
jgi:PadR family transcriptional regulator PadR